jgi:hypothetical protein
VVTRPAVIVIAAATSTAAVRLMNLLRFTSMQIPPRLCKLSLFSTKAHIACWTEFTLWGGGSVHVSVHTDFIDSWRIVAWCSSVVHFTHPAAAEGPYRRSLPHGTHSAQGGNTARDSPSSSGGIRSSILGGKGTWGSS